MKKLERFIENARIDSNLLKRAELTPNLQERINSNTKLTESYESAKQIWEVPISAYDTENANGRVYSRALWENVINNQRPIWEGSPMLTNHPSGDSDGSPSDICGIWLDARIAEDGFVYGKFIPSGDHGKNLEEHLGNGLRAGTSSSGFGELASDGRTVEASTYQIERLSDWVLNPSQGTFFTFNSKKENVNSESSIKESANTDRNKLKEGAPSVKISKLEEKKFRKDIQAFLEDANYIEDPNMRLKELEEILSYFGEGIAPDLREEVEKKFSELEDSIREAAKHGKVLKEELGIENPDDLREKLSKIASEVSIIKEDALDWQQVSSKLQEKIQVLKEALKDRPTQAYVEHLRNRNKKLFNENNVLSQRLKESEEFKTKLEEKKTETLEVLKTTIGTYKETIEYLKKRNSEIIKESAKKDGASERKIKEMVKAQEEADAENQRILEAKQAPIVKRISDEISPFLSFQETSEIDKYWADLVVRHGVDIKPFEERVRGAKTLKEAMSIYMKVLPSLNESVDYYAAKLPESVSLGKKTRGKILESKGMKFETSSSSKLPKGWV